MVLWSCNDVMRYPNKRDPSNVVRQVSDATRREAAFVAENWGTESDFDDRSRELYKIVGKQYSHDER